MKNTIRTTIILIIILVGCNPNPDDSNAVDATGLTILGLDGATWEIIDQLIAQGELPGFRLLKETGSWGYLQTFRPTESISIWTSIATGVSPSRHGLQTFTRRVPGTDRYIPSPSTDRLVPALWNMSSQHEKSVVVVKWFASWPAEEVNGAFISSRLEPDDSDPRTYPLNLYAEIDPFRHQSSMNSIPQPPLPVKSQKSHPDTPLIQKQSAPGDPPMLIGQSEVPTVMFDDTTVWLAGKHVFEKYQPDLFMIYLKSTDRVQHFLWGAHRGDSNDPVVKAEAEAIFGWYRFYDSIILDLLKDPDRNLMVISDHGFHALADSGEPYHTGDIDYDRLLELGDFLQRDNKSTIWNQTSCYTYRVYPFDRGVEFRVNLEGREPQGVISNDRAGLLLTDITSYLHSLRISDDQDLFSEILIDDATASIRCIVNAAVHLDQTVSVNNQTIPLSSIIQKKGLPRGIHTNAPPGIIAIRGPGIRRGFRIDQATVFDVTPTSLHILDLPVASDFDGASLVSIFQDEWLAAHPIRKCESYGRRIVSNTLMTSPGDHRLMDELRSLGYIQ